MVKQHEIKGGNFCPSINPSLCMTVNDVLDRKNLITSSKKLLVNVLKCILDKDIDHFFLPGQSYLGVSRPFLCEVVF